MPSFMQTFGTHGLLGGIVEIGSWDVAVIGVFVLVWDVVNAFVFVDEVLTTFVFVNEVITTFVFVDDVTNPLVLVTQRPQKAGQDNLPRSVLQGLGRSLHWISITWSTHLWMEW